MILEMALASFSNVITKNKYYKLCVGRDFLISIPLTADLKSAIRKVGIKIPTNDI